ncbi:hypothetical protein [Solilutibacter silvestris]|uniref:hypothetical protein n=1 Tax=Solilutibacter silvestris TaxID=1645665 RepID=UPI003D342366
MSKFVALFQFLLALSGCSQSGTSYSHRVQSESETLYSKIHVQDGVSRFECVDSSSGQCQYTLYPDACGGLASCKLPPLQHFAIARGESRQLTGLVDFRPCVTTTAAIPGADCQPATTPH